MSRKGLLAHLRKDWRVIAESILDRYAVNDARDLDIEAIAEAEGIEVIEKPMEGAEGRLVRGAKGARIVVKEGLRPIGKKRFVVAHEFGHYLQENRTSQAHLIVDANLISIYQHDQQETEANILAAELLMPERWIRPLIDGKKPSFKTIKSIAEDLRTTLTATALRFVDLTREPVALVVSEGGRISWWRTSSSDWYYKIRERGSELPGSTCAHDLFIGKWEEPNPTPVDVEGWFAMENLKDDAEIYEHSVKLGEYPIVLTLLWVDKDPTYPMRSR